MLALSECETNQLPYSFALARDRTGNPAAFGVEHSVGIICYSPLAQGLLTGRLSFADEVPPGLAQTRWYTATG